MNKKTKEEARNEKRPALSPDSAIRKGKRHIKAPVKSRLPKELSMQVIAAYFQFLEA